MVYPHFVVDSPEVLIVESSLCVCVFCVPESVSGSSDTYLLREERDDLSTDGTETLDNLRL